MTAFKAALTALIVTLSLLVVFTRPAGAASLTVAQRDNLALNWAETQAGKPYIWGGTGPGGYDCSGLVQAAFRHAGIILPRTTYQMLASPHLTRVRVPSRGDLAFLGTGHVEIITRWRYTTFGAHDSGTRVSWLYWGWDGGWPAGTMFFEVR